jgi:hypothetical protein
MSKRSKGANRPATQVPHSLAEASTYLSGVAERSEDVSKRLRGAADFLSQVVEVEEGVRRSARKFFRFRTLVIIALVVAAVLVVRTLRRQQSADYTPPVHEPDPAPSESPGLTGATQTASD